MAGVLSILGAVGRTVWRDLQTFQSVTANNLFLLTLLLMQQMESAFFLLLLFGLLVIVPLSADPLRKIPADRLKLWPLTQRQRIALRAASFCLSPIIWIALLIFWISGDARPPLTFVGCAALVQGLVFACRSLTERAPAWNPLRHLPGFPGPLGRLVQKDLRQMLSTLDPYAALALSLGGTAYRFFSKAPNPAAFPAISLLIALTLSTYAQALFGLDGPAGVARYRLMPLRGWQILVSKDAAFLLVLTVLVLPLQPLAGMAAGLIALAFGRHTAAFRPMVQHRWRFSSGVLFPTGVIQTFLLAAAGVAVDRIGPVFVLPCLLCYLVSLWYGGWIWDRQRGFQMYE